MSGRAKKIRNHRPYPRPPKAVPPELASMYMVLRGIISWFLLRLPIGSLRKAEEERIDRLTNWGRW